MSISVDEAFDDFNAILEKLSGDKRKMFLENVKDRVKELADEEEEDIGNKNKDIILNRIREQLRRSLPITGTAKTEGIIYPTVGPYSKVDPKTVIHVDAFLYDDELYDELCDQGKLSRNYCLDCGSHNVKPLTVLTHSASVTQIKYIFEYLLGSLKGRTLLDIGSRTGAILYGAFLYTDCQTIVGVEMDPTFFKLQEQIINDFSFGNRIKVFEEDIVNCLHLISESNVVILNNVFEFFSPKEQQIRLWKAIILSLRKPGITVITVPSLEETLEHLGVRGEIDMDWLVPKDVRSLLHEAKETYLEDGPDNDELDNIFVYTTMRP